MVAGFLWAAGEEGVTGSLSPWLTLANLGVAGLVLYLLIFKQKIHTDAEVKAKDEQIASECKRADKAEAENHRLHTLIEEMVIPALSRSTDLIARSMEDRGKRERPDDG